MHLCDIEFLDPKKTDVFFMVLSKTRDNPFCYCCNVKELYNDWMEDAENCPENDAQLLQVVFYVQKEVTVQGTGNWDEELIFTETQPVTDIGLNQDISFDNLMEQIKKCVNKRRIC